MIILFLSVPTKIKELKQTKSTTDSITFNWQPPNPPNGKLSNYSIQIWNSNNSKFLRDFLTPDIELHIDGLEGFKTYRVRVRTIG